MDKELILSQNLEENAAIYQPGQEIDFEKLEIGWLVDLCKETTASLKETCPTSNLVVIPTGSILHTSFLRKLDASQSLKVSDLVYDVDVVVMGDISNEDIVNYYNLSHIHHTEFRRRLKGKYPELDVCPALNITRHPFSLENSHFPELAAKLLATKKPTGNEEAIETVVVPAVNYLSNVFIAKSLYPELDITVVLEDTIRKANEFDQNLGDPDWFKENILPFINRETGLNVNSMSEMVAALAASPLPRLKYKHIARLVNAENYNLADPDKVNKIIEQLKKAGVHVAPSTNPYHK